MSSQQAPPPSSSQSSADYREAFSLYDKRGNGRVALKDLGELLRACGQNPTLQEIRDLEQNVGADFDFETFSRVLNRPGGFREPMPPDEYAKAFRVFDKDGSGFVGVGQLKYLLTTMGDRLTEAEYEDMIKLLDTTNDEVNYIDMINKIIEH
ncbi:myosin regulatory light chain cdc4 [Lineolata rhizophorae]|uniref:Calmodulin n=1 Tax=Lineolata rhizophorae TaxID=578093 RepID=A0A6A6NTL4_9PEZI|nr:myosin regulatory light chain cdc4 [Lineolata rhizophorae]